MIPDSQTNTLYLADCLPTKHPKFFADFEVILKKFGITFQLLPETKDIWAVDYMPVQVTLDKFVQFVYNPDYLQSQKWIKTISDVDIICNSIKLNRIKSDIVLDGGNVTKTTDKVIMCDKIFIENPHYSRRQLADKLREFFEVDKLYFVPQQPKDFTGHADGMVRFLDNDTVIINDHSKEKPEFQRAFKIALDNAGLDYIEIPYNPYGNKTFGQANGGEIGTQGSPTSPSGNRWGAFNSSHINLYHTYTFNTFNANTNSVMYCRPNTSPCSFGTFKWFPCVNQTFNFSGIDNYLSGSGLQTSTGLTLACATIVVGPPALKMADVVNSITDNSANGNFAQNIRFKQKRFGFTSTKEDNTGTLMSNSTINNFYTQTQPQNIGLLSTTEDLINQKQYSSAKINNLVSPVNNTVEANYQLIYDKVLEQLVDTGYVYTTSDIAQIESVAQLCIQENGEAVTMARALLASIKKEGVSYNNDCIEIPFDNNGNRLMQQEETTNSVSEVSDVLIYPNPNKGTFTVQYETNEEEQLTLTIVELTGKIVHQETLPVGFQEKEIITENIGTGFYFITIKTKSGILTYSTKMSIVK